MITPEDMPPLSGASANSQDGRPMGMAPDDRPMGMAPDDRPMGMAPDDGRMTLEELVRTLPIRNIWGLFRGYREDMAKTAGLAALGLDNFNAGQRAFSPGADPLADGLQPKVAAWDAGPLPDDADETTRAAYNVANQQFQAGEAVAKELAQTAMMARAQDVPTLLNRLLETYSDLGSVGVQLIGAALAQAQSAPQTAAQSAAPAAASPQTAPSIAVEVTASCSVTARALLFAPLGASPRALTPVRVGGEGALPPPEVKPGPVVHITVPEGTAAGEYHGIILAEADGAPAGTVTIKIAAPT